MTHVELLKKALKNSSLKIKKLPGSSEYSVFLVGGKNIYKVGPSHSYLEEKKYEALKANLGNLYESIFPRIERVYEANGNCVWKMKFLGTNFEDIVFSEKGRRLSAINASVLKNIRDIFSKTSISGHKMVCMTQVFDEIIDAMKKNLTDAGLLDRYARGLKRLGAHKEDVISGCVPSISHKDLTVGNIIAGSRKVFFIDPRKSVPNSDMQGGHGNVAIDLIGYQISILRKYKELGKRKDASKLVAIMEDIKKDVRQYEANRVFSRKFRLLCQALWYSVYLSCNCAYCMAEERVWLYQDMEKEFDLSFNKLMISIGR